MHCKRQERLKEDLLKAKSKLEMDSGWKLWRRSMLCTASVRKQGTPQAVRRPHSSNFNAPTILNATASQTTSISIEKEMSLLDKMGSKLCLATRMVAHRFDGSVSCLVVAPVLDLSGLGEDSFLCLSIVTPSSGIMFCGSWSTSPTFVPLFHGFRARPCSVSLSLYWRRASRRYCPSLSFETQCWASCLTCFTFGMIVPHEWHTCPGDLIDVHKCQKLDVASAKKLRSSFYHLLIQLLLFELQGFQRPSIVIFAFPNHRSSLLWTPAKDCFSLMVPWWTREVALRSQLAVEANLSSVYRAWFVVNVRAKSDLWMTKILSCTLVGCFRPQLWVSFKWETWTGSSSGVLWWYCRLFSFGCALILNGCRCKVSNLSSMSNTVKSECLL